MSTADNGAIIRCLTEDGWNRRNLAVFDRCIAPDRVWHDPTGPDIGSLERLKTLATEVMTAVPDVHFTIDDQIARGDKVVSRIPLRGTQRGELLGSPQTGKRLTVTVVVIDRIPGGKIVETWPLVDDLGRLGLAWFYLHRRYIARS
jgi:predicted ester cyclase